jgi:hypothetical protein
MTSYSYEISPAIPEKSSRSELLIVLPPTASSCCFPPLDVKCGFHASNLVLYAKCLGKSYPREGIDRIAAYLWPEGIIFL